MKPLQTILSGLEESIKRTVLPHKEEVSGEWANLNQRLESSSTLSVCCDCSVMAGRFHLGVCIAGLQTCKLFGCSVSARFPQHNVLGELQALEFAIQCAERYIGNLKCEDAIKSMAVFSDVSHIQQLLRTKNERLHPPATETLRRLNERMKWFSGTYPKIRLRVNYLGNDAQRGNIYYHASHKVARIVARANSKTVSY